MSATIDILLRASGQASVTSSLQAVRTSGQDAATASRALQEALRRIDEPGGLARAEQAADDYRAAADRAQQASQQLNGQLERLRNAGAAMAVAGGAGIMLSHSLAEAAREGDKAALKMEAMLEKMGEMSEIEPMNDWAGKLAFDAAMTDDDPLKDAAAGLSGYGMQAEKIRGLMPGLIGQSRLYNQSLEGTSEAAGRAFAKGDMDSLARIGVVITEQQKAQMKSLEGAGASMGEKQAAMYEILKSSFDQYALSMTEGLSESEIAANRLALEMDNVQSAIGKGSADAEASLSRVAVSVLQVIGANEQVSYSLGWMLTMGSYGLTAAGSLLTVASQAAMTGMALQSMGFTGAGAWSMIRTAAISAGTATWAAIAPLLPLIAAVAAVALIAAAAIYALDRAWNHKEDKELAANIAKGDEASVKLLEIENKKRAKKGQSQLTMEQFQGNPDADLLKENPGAGDKGAVDVEKARADLAKFQSGNLGAAPAMPLSGATLPVVGGAALTSASAAKSSEKAEKAAEKVAEKVAEKSQKEAERARKAAERDRSKEAREDRKELRSQGQPPLAGGAPAQPKAEPLVSRGAALIAFLQGGGSVGNFKGTPTPSAGSSGVSRETRGPRTGELELSEVSRSQSAGGDETVEVRGKLKLSGGGRTSLGRLAGTL